MAKSKKQGTSKKIKKAGKRLVRSAKNISFDDVEKVIIKYGRLANKGVKEAESITRDIKKHWGRISKEINKK